MMKQFILKIFSGFLLLAIVILANNCKNEKEINYAVIIELKLSNLQNAKMKEDEPALLTLSVHNQSGSKIFLENLFPIPIIMRSKIDGRFKELTGSHPSPHPVFIAEWDSTQNERYESILESQKSPPDSLINLASNVVFEENDNYDNEGLKILLSDIYESRIYLKESETFKYSIPLNISALPSGKYQIISNTDKTNQFFEGSLEILKKYGIDLPEKDDGFKRWTEPVKGDTLEFKT